MKNKQGGFLKLIIFIIVVIFLMNYFHITITGIVNWFVTMFQNII
ncbi:MAG: hypothetical protein WC264_00850 [Candidatus Paceibacterota bacterium]